MEGKKNTMKKTYFKANICFCLICLSVIFTMPIIAQGKPFGTVKVSNDVYIDETEVDVGSWLSYYSWLIIHEGFESAQKVLPDSSSIEPELWAYIKNKSTDNIDVQARYSLQPIGYFGKECKECAKFGRRLSSERKYCAMLNLPITGITYEQVKGFCEWRAKVEGENKLVFRLPTPEEWKDFALNCLSETERKNGFRDSLNNKKCPLYNFKSICICNKDSVQGKLNGIGLYESNKMWAFDVYGNVSEMTSIKGVAKGGNYLLYANQCHPDSIQHYNKSEKWLGFRCIAVKKTEGNISSGINIPKKTGKDTSVSTQPKNKYESYTDARDGRTYRTTQIENQIWLAENLAYKPVSGEYWSWNNDTSYVAKYGYLYSWQTAQNVCPVGWHLPSKAEFEALLLNVGNNNPKIVLNKLIETGSSGLSIRLNVGSRLGKNNFSTMESALWSSTEKNHSNAWALYYCNYDPIFQMNGHIYKQYGLPIRCVKDK